MASESKTTKKKASKKKTEETKTKKTSGKKSTKTTAKKKTTRKTTPKKATTKSKVVKPAKRENLSAAISRSMYPDRYAVSKDPLTDKEKEAHWHELNTMYNTIAKGLVELSGLVSTVVTKAAELPLLPEDRVKIRGLVDAFKFDIQGLSDELLRVKKMHEGKEGMVEGNDDMFDFLGIFQEYSKISEVMTTSIQPVYAQIAKIIFITESRETDKTKASKEAEEKVSEIMKEEETSE